MTVSAVLSPHAPLRLPPEGPYVGLTAFDDDDAAPFFFGRAAEQRIVATNLMTSRLTLVYGPTGVGKSSLLRAGVARRLRLEAEAAVAGGRMPQSIGLVFHNWRDEPLPALVSQLERTLGDVLGPLMPASPEPADDLVGVLDGWTSRLAERAAGLEDETGVRQPSQPELLLIFDQFEEYFLYEPDAGCERRFADEFPRAVNRRGLPANFAIAIREDAYTLLDRFEGEIPNLFGNNIRLEHLDRGAAEQAIRGPVELYAELSGEDVPRRVDDDLTEAVLSEIRAGNLALGQTGVGRVEGAEEERYETAFLQLVLRAIWAAARKDGDEALQLKTLSRLGGAGAIADRHLTAAVEALRPRVRTAAARMFTRLVTPSGAKIAYTASDLAKQDRLPVADVQAVLDRMVPARILRTVHAAPGSDETRYELFHDVLAPAMLGWSGKLEERRLRRETARARRLLFALLALFALVVAATAVIYLALRSARDSREDALGATDTALLNERIAKATVALGRDPAQALKIAVRAAGPGSRREAQDVLRKAALASREVAVIHGGGPAVAIAFSPGGTRVAIAHAGGRVDIRAAGNGDLVGSLPNTGRVVAAAFSPDGSRLALRRAGEPVRVWDVTTGRLVYSGPRRATAIALTAGGRRLAAATHRGIEFWGGTGRLSSGKLPPSVSLTFDPHGRDLLAAFTDGSAAIVRPRDAEPLHWFKDPAAQFVGVRSERTGFAPLVAYSGDGKLLATARSDGKVRMYDVRSGHRLGRSFRHGAAVTSLAFASDDRIAIGGADGHAEVVRLRRRGKPVALIGHTDAISNIAVAGDRQWIATAGGDDTARVWSVGSGAQLAELRGHTDRISTVAFDRATQRIATAGDDGTVRVWRAPGDQADAVLARRHGAAGGVSFSADGATVLVPAADGSVTVSSPRGDETRLVAKPDTFLRGLIASGTNSQLMLDILGPRAALSSDGRRALVAGYNGAALYDVRAAKPVRRFGRPARPDNLLLGVGPGRAWGVLATSGEPARLIDGWTGATVGTLPRSGTLGELAPSAGAGGRYIAAVTSGAVRVWDLAADKRRRDLRVPDAFLTRVALDPSGTAVAAASTGGVVYVWDAPGRRPRMLDLGTYPRDLRFSPGGRYLAATGDGSSARVWDLKTWHKYVLRGHTAAINSIAFSPGARLVVTASDDGSVRVWTPQGEPRAVVRPLGHAAATGAEFSPDGSRIAITGSRGAAGMYACELCGGPRQLLAYAQAHVPRSR